MAVRVLLAVPFRGVEPRQTDGERQRTLDPGSCLNMEPAIDRRQTIDGQYGACSSWSQTTPASWTTCPPTTVSTECRSFIASSETEK